MVIVFRQHVFCRILKIVVIAVNVSVLLQPSGVYLSEVIMGVPFIILIGNEFHLLFATFAINPKIGGGGGFAKRFTSGLRGRSGKSYG